MVYKLRIAELLANALVETGLPPDQLPPLAEWVEIPRDKSHGDYAFPCFRLAKQLRKNPNQIASDLHSRLLPAVAADPDISEVNLLGGYLNFRADKATLAAELVPGILHGDFLARRAHKNSRVMIEYSQPNTHKAFHVGHSRNVALGDALVRIYEWSGFDVIAANYIGDEGAHIAKCLWYYLNYFHGEIPDSNRGEFLGELYTKATELLDFELLTRCPIPKVVVGQVLAIEAISDKLKLVQVQDGLGQHQVVCGGTGFAVSDRVAYARVGARIAGRMIAAVEKSGVHSDGMICSEKELGFSEDNLQIHLLPPDAPLGTELAEFYRIPGSLDPAIPVLEEMKRRSEGVSAVLKQLESQGGEVYDLWQKTRQWSLHDFNDIYQWLDSRFDHFFYESEVGNRGKEIVLEYLAKGVFKKSDGAIICDLSADNLPVFLVLKSDGTGLYSTKDLALAREKFEKFGVDKSIYVVDASQSLHFQQVFKTLEKMGYEKARDCFHLAYGLVVLPEGKMSSRAGNVILFSELKRRLDQRIKSDFLEKYRRSEESQDEPGKWPAAEIDAAARAISIATIKYGMLNQDNMKNIVFDLGEWTARSGNTGPYLLYAYARTRSVLRELGDFDLGQADWSLLTHESEQELLNQLSKFPSVVERACKENKPSTICHYLYALSKDFSRMYDHCSVLHAETPALKAARAGLVDAFGRLLKQGLALLGIQTIERM